uniref:Odorant receptor n=1 Tax=Adelphocoris suturalis TaxID=323751 RepID=A0A7T7FRK4_9HEMI|nr:olfactory receptor 4 [Adelphocoris suturalis]
MVLVPFFIKPQIGRNAAIDRGYKLTSMFYARLAGLYPDLEAGWRYWFFGTYLNFVYVAYVYYVSAYMIANVIAVKYKDFELIGSTFCFGSYTYVYALITIMFLIKRQKIGRLLEIVGNDVYKYRRPPTKEEILIKETESMKAIVYGRYTFYIPCSVALMQMAVVPAIHGLRGEYTSIVNGSTPIDKYSPLPVWTPVEATTGLSFFVLYWCQLCPGFVEFLIFHGSCTFYIGVTCALVSNLKLLHHSLGRIVDRAEYLYDIKNGKYDHQRKIPLNTELFDECMVECLKENVQHHVEIIKFHHLFQDIVGYSNLFIFSGAAVTISTPPFTIIKIAELGDRHQLLTAGIVMIGHAFLSLFLLAQYCKYGQSIEDESEKILESYYFTPWFKASKSFRQVLVVAMSNSLKPLEIKSAVVGISASAATYMSIIKSAYSMLNFLVTAK